VPIRGEAPVDDLAEVYADGRAWLGEADWFDAHTHMGSNDPDGVKATPEEILAGLDDAGHRRALLFPMHEPGGYPAANDAALAACAASGGRLEALVRVDPNAPGAVAEARRGLDAGARGIKLHPRSDAFGLPHPVVDELVALAGERRAIVLFHAGRGIPVLGLAAAALARGNPGASIILAHAGISDLGLLREESAELENLFFDTAWWQVADVLQLMATIPPARILYASDLPYAPGRFTALLLLRTARAAGHPPEVVREMAGGQLARLVEGRPPRDLGPAVGTGALAPREPALERVVAHTAAAASVAFRGGDPGEAVALARLACQTVGEHPHAELLAAVDEVLARAQGHVALTPEDPFAGRSGRSCRAGARRDPRSRAPTAPRVTGITEVRDRRATVRTYVRSPSRARKRGRERGTHRQAHGTAGTWMGRIAG
jgi:predicted TIM-barrel fold metal-dependent hydrolase